VNCIYGLDVSRFEPSINVMVVTEEGLGDLPRFVIRSQGQTVAEAGINWGSPYYAELFVRTEPEAQRRGWGRAVVTSCTTWIIRSGRQPLFVVHDKNRPSRALAEKVGFVDTGAREFASEGVCRP
jgi:predicted GNAT family acetyltransferase